MLFLEENTTQKICGDETEIRMEKGGVWDLENCVCIWYNQISCVFVCVCVENSLFLSSTIYHHDDSSSSFLSFSLANVVRK